MIAAEQTGLPRKQMYDIALTLKKAPHPGKNK